MSHRIKQQTISFDEGKKTPKNYPNFIRVFDISLFSSLKGICTLKRHSISGAFEQDLAIS